MKRLPKKLLMLPVAAAFGISLAAAGSASANGVTQTFPTVQQCEDAGKAGQSSGQWSTYKCEQLYDNGQPSEIGLTPDPLI